MLKKKKKKKKKKSQCESVCHATVKERASLDYSDILMLLLIAKCYQIADLGQAISRVRFLTL
jgi:hypothetical protein